MDALYSYYSARYRELAASLAEGSKDITREGIHRLRVTIKKIKAVFNLLEYLSPEFDSKFHSDLIKPLFTASGDVRDLDITISLLDKIASERIIEQLHTFQRDKVHTLRELIKDLNIDTMLRTDEVASVCDSSRNDIKHVSSFLSLAGHQISDNFSGRLKKKQLHDIRKRLKEFLYLTEILDGTQFGKRSLSQLLPEIEIIQRQLGKWHDIVIAIDEVKKLSGGKQTDVTELNKFLKALEKKERVRVVESITKSEVFADLAHLD